MTTVALNRVWAMPSRHTFAIHPIGELIERYSDGVRWVDPFAGWHSPARYKNDLNPNAPVDSHIDAVEFVRQFDAIDGLLFDPPYSPRQIAECYESIGRTVDREATQNARLYANVKDNAAFRMKVGAFAGTRTEWGSSATSSC